MDIFEPLSKEEIQQLNGQLSDVHLEQGEVFYTPEDRSERLFVLWKGRVRIYKTTEGGKEFTLATVESGTVFGEMAYDRPADAGGLRTGHGGLRDLHHAP